MKKRMISALLAAGILLVLLYGAGKWERIAKEEQQSETESPGEENFWVEPQEESIWAALVQVKADNMQGNGIIFEVREEYLLVVTAAHVLEQGVPSVTVVFADGTMAEAEECRLSQSSDLAFVHVSKDAVANLSPEQYQAVAVDKDSFDAIQAGDVLTFAAYGSELLSGTVSENWIFVEDFNQHMMLVQGNIVPGMSGGGVFNSSGYFCGILCGQNEKGEVAVLPWSIIQAEYLGMY